MLGPNKGTVRLERYEFFPKLAKTVPYGLKQQGKIEFCAIEVGFGEILGNKNGKINKFT